MSSQPQQTEGAPQGASGRSNPPAKSHHQQQYNASPRDKKSERPQQQHHSNVYRPTKPHHQPSSQNNAPKNSHKKQPMTMATATTANSQSSSYRTRQESVSPNVCVICCSESDLFCIGQCRHPVCLECATRIRVLGKNNLCSHCRLDLPEVYYVPFMGSWDDWVPPRNCVGDRQGAQYGIKFANKDAVSAFSDFLAHVCTVCPKEPEFQSFEELKRHMERQHELFYCELCVEHLQLYSWERKCYSRKELDTHRRLGDGDDKSHRGHPDCKFCRKRFLDHDHLYRHLRRDHYYCQLCEADGDANTFYSAYEELKVHYKDRHFVCEEDGCKDAAHIVFRTEIDLKGHMSKEHKAGRQTIQLDFNFSDRTLGQQQGGYRSGSGRARGGAGGNFRGDHHQQRSSRPTRQPDQPAAAEPLPVEDVVIDLNDPSTGSSKIRSVVRVSSAQAQPRSNFEMQKEEFPSLGGNSRRNAPSNNSTAPNVYQNRGAYRRSDSLERSDFPALPSDMNTHRPVPAVQSAPRLNALVAGTRSAHEPPKKTFGIIDDDENFPSFTVTNQIAEQKREAAAKAKAVEHDGSSSARQQQPPSLFQSLTSGSWTQRPASLSQAAMCISGQEEFPSLGGQGKLRGKREAPLSGVKKNSAWTKGSLTHSAIVGCTVNSSDTRKNGELPTPDIWPKTLKAEKPTEKEIEEANKLKLAPTVGKMLKLESNAKTKARRVAQQKQRHSEDASPMKDVDAANFDENSNARPLAEKQMSPPGLSIDDSPRAAVSSMPPGFERDVVGAPPGLDRTPSLIAAEHRYDRPFNFDDRNRLLFSTLDHRLSPIELDKFKSISAQFRKGEVDADNYLAEISALLTDRLSETLPELICLLPDIQRQRDLLEAYEKLCDQQAGARPKKSWNPTGTDFTVKMIKAFRFRMCPTCGQVLVDADFNTHLGKHHLFDEFPTLHTAE